MRKPNTLVILRQHYPSQEAFEQAVGKALLFLLNNQYILTATYDAGEIDLGVLIIKYESADPDLRDIYPYWLNADDAEYMFNHLEDKITKEGN